MSREIDFGIDRLREEPREHGPWMATKHAELVARYTKLRELYYRAKRDGNSALRTKVERALQQVWRESEVLGPLPGRPRVVTRLRFELLDAERAIDWLRQHGFQMGKRRGRRRRAEKAAARLWRRGTELPEELFKLVGLDVHLTP